MKNRKVVVAMALILICLLSACSNKENEAYDNAMSQGEKYVKSLKMEKAEASFEMALNTKEKDQKAQAYLNQVKDYSHAIKKMSEKDYKNAQKIVKTLPYQKDSLNVLEKAVTTTKKKLAQLVSEEKALVALFQEAKKESKDKNYKGSNDKLEQFLKKDVSILSDDTLKASVDKLLKDNNEKLKKQEEKAVLEASSSESKSETTSSHIINNAQEAQAYIQKNRPQVGDLTPTSEDNGIYYFTAESGVSKRVISVDMNGHFTEEMIEDTAESNQASVDWEQIARDKVTDQFPEFEVANFEDAGEGMMNVFIREIATGVIASHAVGSINTSTGETSGF